MTLQYLENKMYLLLGEYAPSTSETLMVSKLYEFLQFYGGLTDRRKYE